MAKNEGKKFVDVYYDDELTSPSWCVREGYITPKGEVIITDWIGAKDKKEAEVIYKKLIKKRGRAIYKELDKKRIYELIKEQEQRYCFKL